MASSVDVKNLEGRKNEDTGALTPRDFFWDSIAQFVLYVIAGITVFEAVAEWVRGSNVECFLPEGIGNATQEYINTFCSGNIPQTQYFPVYIAITGLLIAVPHYIWLNQYRGNFEFFFSLVANLNRPMEGSTDAEHHRRNIKKVRRLTTAFATYKESPMFFYYVMKLALQWLFTALSIALAFVFFRNNYFMEGFLCPQNLNVTIRGFWPFEEQAFCIYNTLVLISYLRIVYVVLVCILLICLSWALFWCFCTHATELGREDEAQFTYLTGLPTKYYVAHLPIPSWSCCRFLRSCILKFVTTIPWFTFGDGPRIRSDLDFMVMQLYRTDSGLGYTFKDIQTNLALEDLLNDDQRRLHIHYLKHTTKSEYDGMYFKLGL